VEADVDGHIPAKLECSGYERAKMAAKGLGVQWTIRGRGDEMGGSRSSLKDSSAKRLRASMPQSRVQSPHAKEESEGLLNQAVMYLFLDFGSVVLFLV